MDDLRECRVAVSMPFPSSLDRPARRAAGQVVLVPELVEGDDRGWRFAGTSLACGG
jgi:hypothetical protein